MLKCFGVLMNFRSSSRGEGGFRGISEFQYASPLGPLGSSINFS